MGNQQNKPKKTNETKEAVMEKSVTKGILSKMKSTGSRTVNYLKDPAFWVATIGVVAGSIGSYMGANYLYNKFGKSEDVLTGKKANVFRK